MSFVETLNLATEDPLSLFSRLAEQEHDIQNVISELRPKCNPWTNLSCPFILYIVILIITLIIAIWIIITQIKRDKQGRTVTNNEKLAGASIALGIHFVAGFIIAWLIFEACKNCDDKDAWSLFWLAIFVPIIFLIIGLFITEATLGVELIFRSSKSPIVNNTTVNNTNSETTT